MERNYLMEHARMVLGVCQLLDRFHAGGFVHGDLTLHNVMWDETDHPILIDLAASSNLDDLPRSKRQPAIDDDFSELYRDLVLTQFHVGILSHFHARKSVQMIDDLFSADILPTLNKLKSRDYLDEIP
jgi:serine/threonine protein kinase